MDSQNQIMLASSGGTYLVVTSRGTLIALSSPPNRRGTTHAVTVVQAHTTLAGIRPTKGITARNV
jgi:hypothetical protein